MTTHLRIAASVCVLSTGLMIAGAGGATATADTDSGTATNTNTGQNSANTPAAGPVGTIADSVRKAVQNSLQGTVQTVTGALSAIPKPGQVPFGVPKPPKTTFGGTPTVYGSTGPTTAPAPDADPAPETNTVASTTNEVVAPATSTPAPPSSVAPDPLAAATNVVTPVTNAITTVADTVGTAPNVIASLSTSTAPVVDVLTYVQNVLTSVGDAGTSLAQLPTDLAGLLGVSATTPTSTIGPATGTSGVRTVAATSPTPSGWSSVPQLLAVPGVHGGPAATPPPVPVTPLDIVTRDAARDPSNAAAPAAPKEAGSTDVLSVVEHVIGAFVATVSLTALAAVALPGLAGLLTTCAAGIRVGYRQAKAASELPNTAISRFVGSGPVGVVRTGSQVQLRSRVSHVLGAKSRNAAPTRALRVVGSESSTTELLDHAV
ncbi:MAG: hypothetical protein JWR11_534 [Mycobacterium sp.]|nr:hypothetical protein [Mycobacterium sp.]